MKRRQRYYLQRHQCTAVAVPRLNVYFLTSSRGKSPCHYPRNSSPAAGLPGSSEVLKLAVKQLTIRSHAGSSGMSPSFSLAFRLDKRAGDGHIGSQVDVHTGRGKPRSPRHRACPVVHRLLHHLRFVDSSAHIAPAQRYSRTRSSSTWGSCNSATRLLTFSATLRRDFWKSLFTEPAENKLRNSLRSRSL